MSDILNKKICLTLNKVHQAYEMRTVRKAVEDITSLSPQTGEPPFKFVDITYEQLEDGSYNMENVVNYRAVSVDEWMTLEVRSCDIPINCGRCQLRAPTIIIASNFDRVKEIVPQFSGDAVRQREKGRCAVTGRELAPGEGDVGHDVARAKGGKRNWTNTAYMTKGLNRLMGTKSFDEMGWGHVRKKMVQPKARKVFLTLKDAEHESHLFFLRN